MRAKTLKQSLLDFVLDAEGDLATALESFSATQSMQWSKTNLQGVSQNELAIDMFLTEGQVGDQSVIDVFLNHQPDLAAGDRALVASWQRGFNGLFALLQATPDGYELMNWLTEKRYWVKPNGLQAEETLARLKPGEIINTRIIPVTEEYWTFSGPLMLLGKLGKPKLAVAIGNFKNWFPQHLYGDAPDLLEDAWMSVEQYHQEFVEFFGGDRLTLSGHELGKKLKDYQQTITQRRLDEAGLDGSKSLKEMAEEAGVSEDEVAESVSALGEDGKAVRALFKGQTAMKMVMPDIELPEPLRRAEAVTVFVHPRWGQTFLTDYERLRDRLKESDAALSEPPADDTIAEAVDQPHATLDRLTLKYLKEDAVTPHIWRCLVEEAPNALEASLRRVLQNPDFDLRRDLEATLVKFGKPLEPRLPEIASVPLHLHNLFQEALQEVNASSSKKKSKGKKKQSAGFGR